MHPSVTPKMDGCHFCSIKFRGYCIGLVSSILTVLSSVLFYYECMHRQSEYIFALRYTGITPQVLGIAWKIANIFLLIGLVKEKKVFLYPFCGLFTFEMCVILLDEILGNVVNISPYHYAKALIVTTVLPYVGTTMIQLCHLFDMDSIQKSVDRNGSVRFDRDDSKDVNRGA